jgi:predicted nucleotidyltransferase|tara:strand:- start:523 stop:813 length:291 start_codon:yes stop_codon:yes gene_type:complete
MASRYRNNEIKTTNDGRRVYRSRLYPDIPLSDTDIYVVTETYDRFDTLAYQYYTDASLWWIIASANNIHDAPFGITDGTLLRIPTNYIQISNNFNQ